MTLRSIDEHKNTNGILVYKADEDWGEGIVETGNTITPGMIVTKGTDAGDLIPDNDSGKATGWAADNVTNASESLRADYAAGKRVRYGRSPGDKFMGLIASGQNLTKGAKLKTASGKLVAGTEGTDKLVAVIIQEGGTGGALGADGYFLCKWGVSA